MISNRLQTRRRELALLTEYRPACEKYLCRIGGLIFILITSTQPVYAAIHHRDELADLSLEELANIQITSVSKKAEALADAPASVFVITGEDIRRSGATSLPEALRLAPNLQVARVDARNYAVTARGFNSPFANKLLVLIDGRTVYSPLFSGVFWDAQDVVLEDVERIEVVSGAGATLWGANAVNGVINVITRTAADTQGALAAAGAGGREKNGAVRYGGALQNGGHYRVYGKYADSDDTQRANGSMVADGWRRKQAGFRADWGDKSTGLTLQGDVYNGGLHQQGTTNVGIAGANLLGRMNRKLADDSAIRLQAYLDHTERDQPGAFVEHLDTVDVELQHTLQVAVAHDVVWGAGYRAAFDRVRNGPAFAFLPGSLTMHWANLFVQDEVELHKAVWLTVGMKLENNNYTGMEFLPSARLAWKPATHHLVWGSASRAVRAPSRIDRDFFAPPNPAVVNGVPRFFIGGGPDFVSEVVNAYEIGYRVQPLPAVSYSLTAFYNVHDKLRTLEPNPNGFGSVFSNKAEGSTHGVEMWGSWQVIPSWRLAAGLVVQKMHLQLKPDSVDASGESGLANNDPSHFWMLRSSFDISQDKEVDFTLRHTGKLPRPEVPSYTTMDLQFGWKIQPDLELSVVGQNLLNSSHVEFGAAATRSMSERSAFLKLVWRI
jgi:iron complex outermembrane receptor protein